MYIKALNIKVKFVKSCPPPLDRSRHAGICMKVAQVEASAGIHIRQALHNRGASHKLFAWLGYEKPTRSLTFRLLPCMAMDAWMYGC